MKGRSKQMKVVLVNYMLRWGSYFKSVRNLMLLIGDMYITGTYYCMLIFKINYSNT